MERVLITGDAGFIGFHVSRNLLNRGAEVLGVDGMTDYYDPALKAARLRLLQGSPNFTHVTSMLEDLDQHHQTLRDFSPTIIVHLAAQAGVRYSLENPDAYISSNVEGTLRVLELARDVKPAHLMIASTSSVYGGNLRSPFAEIDAVSSPVSLYAATKLATEALAHSFSHLWKIPTTVFRFFTVYGPWGRPDMALFKFVDAMEKGSEIDVYGHGKMRRDFTYVDDLVESILRLATRAPEEGERVGEFDSLSPVAPYRIVNIAGGRPIGLMSFIEAIEEAMGRTAQKRMLDMQPGDVVATWADVRLLEALIGSSPQTSARDGVGAFVDWYLSYTAGVS